MVEADGRKEFKTEDTFDEISLDPIQKRALSRSVQLEAVYLEALLYTEIFWFDKGRQAFLLFTS